MASSQVLVGDFGPALRRVANPADSLADRARRGDRHAFSALMAQHKGALYRFVRRRVTDPDEAYDVVQEAFVSAWGAIVRFDPERPFAAWLRSIALNKCRDHARRRSVRSSFWSPAVDGAAEAVRDEAPSPEEDLIARDELCRLREAVEALPHHLREALTLTAVDGLSQAVAADMLGCTVKAVEYRVHRAREIVAAALMVQA
jgi:RNA polymerase sigma factor CnrH